MVCCTLVLYRVLCIYVRMYNPVEYLFLTYLSVHLLLVPQASLTHPHQEKPSELPRAHSQVIHRVSLTSHIHIHIHPPRVPSTIPSSSPTNAKQPTNSAHLPVTPTPYGVSINHTLVTSSVSKRPGRWRTYRQADGRLSSTARSGHHHHLARN